MLKGEVVLFAQILNGGASGDQCLFQWAPVHGPAAIEHNVEGRRLAGRGDDLVCGEAKGEMDGPGLVGEDGGVIEEQFWFHRWRLSQGYDNGGHALVNDRFE